MPLSPGAGRRAARGRLGRGPQLLHEQGDRPARASPGRSATTCAAAAVQGGSTITQQYVKNYFLTQDRTVSRKFKEFFISIKIDRSTDKNAILQDYLNTIYFGRGAYGIQAASKAYFNKDVSQLTPAEGAVLASVIRAPALYDPAVNPDNGQGPLELRAGRHGARALADPGPGRRAEVPEGRQAPSVGGPRAAPTATCWTSSAREVEAKLHADRQRHRPGRPADRHDLQQGRPGRPRSQAIKDKMPTTGRQGRAGRAGLDQARQRRRRRDVRRAGLGQAAVQRGDPVDDAGRLDVQAVRADHRAGPGDQPEARGSAASSPKMVKGFSQAGRATSAASSSARSTWSRRPSTRSTRSTPSSTPRSGRPRPGRRRSRPGCRRRTAGLTDNPANVLGTASPHVIDMADAYATIAAQGIHADPYTVARVTSTDGQVDYTAKPETERVFDPDVMADTTYAMQQGRPGGTGAAARTSAGRPPARPARRTTTCRPGSTGSPRSWPPRSGCTATARAARCSRSTAWAAGARCRARPSRCRSGRRTWRRR